MEICYTPPRERRKEEGGEKAEGRGRRGKEKAELEEQVRKEKGGGGEKRS